MVPDNYKGVFLDLLIEYTKAQLKVLEDNPTVSTGTIHYRLKKNIEYMETMRGDK